MENSSRRIHPELVAMVAAISITGWHVAQYMAAHDGWLFAAIQGTVLGFCTFLMAHNIFRPNSTNRVPSFLGLCFFAYTSVHMQYSYFAARMGSGEVFSWEALTLGMWAPMAEVILGWVYAAGLHKHTSVASTATVPVQETLPTPRRVPKPLYTPPMPVNTPPHAVSIAPVDTSISEDTAAKREQLAQLLSSGETLSKAEIARRLGVTRKTVYSWMEELQPTVYTNGNGVNHE